MIHRNKKSFFSVKTSVKTISVILSTVFMSHIALASNDTSVGFLAGLGVYNKGYGSQFSLGGNVRHKFLPEFGAGVTFTYASLANSMLGINYSSNVKHIDADFDYYLADLPGLWFGPRLGIGILSTSFDFTLNTTAQSISDSSTAFEVGPAVGYDFMLHENFSVGLDLSYIWAFYSGLTVGAFQALGAIKAHF